MVFKSLSLFEHSTFEIQRVNIDIQEFHIEIQSFKPDMHTATCHTSLGRAWAEIVIMILVVAMEAMAASCSAEFSNEHNYVGAIVATYGPTKQL